MGPLPRNGGTGMGPLPRYRRTGLFPWNGRTGTGTGTGPPFPWNGRTGTGMGPFVSPNGRLGVRPKSSIHR